MKSNNNKSSKKATNANEHNFYEQVLRSAKSYTYYVHLLPEHLNFLKRSYRNQEIVFIYKGFPESFMKQIQQHFPSVLQKSISIENKIDLEAIKRNVTSLAYLQSIHSLSNIGSMWYEEFTVLTKNIAPTLFPNKQFLIIENNFLRLYPNPSNHHFIDLERAIDSEKEFQDDDLFNEFYTNSVIVNDVSYVQYPDLDIDEWPNVIKFDFFQPKGIDVKLTPLNENKITDGFIQFQVDNPQWLDFKYKIYAGIPINEPIKIIVDSASLKDKQSYQEILILQHILEAATIDFAFYHRQNTNYNSFRPELKEILSKYWKSDSFRNLSIYEDPDINQDLSEISQGAICEQVIRQCEIALEKQLHEDTFLTAPTGAGKSVLFQIPAIYLATKSNLITIVVSPLKALMLDQVTALKQDRGYSHVGYINSDISILEKDETLGKIKEGQIHILYLSPELLLSYDLKYFIGDRKIGLLVIDEAHLVTTWGRDFRVDYWFLGNYIRRARKFSNFSFPVFAVTATAVYNGPNDMVFDTIHSLSMKNCKKYIGYVRRDDITFDIRRLDLPSNSPHTHDKVKRTAEIIRSFLRTNRKAIVYFPWISTIGDILRLLTPEEKVQVGEYHSRADVKDRIDLLNNFKTSAIKVVLATKAFGMGVDISDIQEVYHHAPSGSIPDYVQEIGRVARDNQIIGVASTDFHPKDLKFSRILFGLSSLKQWQVRMVLEKIYNIYRINKRRNFLVSIDDFSHIFPNNDDPEQKVKSALLVLEKDMLIKFKYNILVVRPKSLFTTAYARISNAEKASFMDIYGKYVEVESQEVKHQVRRLGKNTTVVRSDNSTSSVLKIQLNKVWEEFFPESGFPEIKHQFFSKQLFPDFAGLTPQMKLIISFNESIQNTLNNLTELFAKLERILNAFQGRYFSKEDLLENLKLEIKEEAVCRNLSNLLITMYSDNNHFGKKGTSMMSDGAFIQKRSNPAKNQDEFRIISGAFGQVKAHSRQRFQTLFGGKSDQEQVIFIAADTDKSKEIVKLAYIMELFNLCTYEIIGGEQPQLFIRINDPLRITRLAKSKEYNNSVVKAVEDRFGSNVRLMTHFFMKEFSNESRWEFIENYFLGRSEEELLEIRQEN